MVVPDCVLASAEFCCTETHTGAKMGGSEGGWLAGRQTDALRESSEELTCTVLILTVEAAG